MSLEPKPRLVRRPSHEINADLMATGPRTGKPGSPTEMRIRTQQVVENKYQDRLVSEYRAASKPFRKKPGP